MNVCTPKINVRSASVIRRSEHIVKYINSFLDVGKMTEFKEHNNNSLSLREPSYVFVSYIAAHSSCLNNKYMMLIISTIKYSNKVSCSVLFIR